MRLALIVALLVALCIAGPASAAILTEPSPGAQFTTTDSAIFVYTPEATDAGDYTFVFSPEPGLNGEYLDLGPGGTEADVDLGWLAAKFNHIGTYWWTVCAVTNQGIATTQCAPQSTFSVRYRLPTL